MKIRISQNFVRNSFVYISAQSLIRNHQVKTIDYDLFITVNLPCNRWNFLMKSNRNQNRWPQKCCQNRRHRTMYSQSHARVTATSYFRRILFESEIFGRNSTIHTHNLSWRPIFNRNLVTYRQAHAIHDTIRWILLTNCSKSVPNWYRIKLRVCMDVLCVYKQQRNS